MEKNQKQILNQATLGWIWIASKGTKRYVALQLGLQAVMSLVSIGYSLLFRLLIDRAAAQNAPGFWVAMGSLAGLALMQMLLRFASRHLEEFSCARLENLFKVRFFEKLLHREYAAVTGVHTGEWMNRLTSDASIVAKGVAQILPNVGGMLIKMTGAFGAILILQPVFGILVIPAGMVIILAVRLLRPVLKRLHSRVQESDGDVRSLMQEHLENLLIIQAYSRQDMSKDQAESRMDAHMDQRMHRSHVSNLSQSGFSLAIQAMYLSAAGICAWGILNGTVTYGTMTAMLQLISHLQSPFYGLGTYLSQWYGMLASAERLMEVEMLPKDSLDEESHRWMDFEEIRGEKLTFAYDSDVSTIHYGDFSVKAREFVAVTGPSGCGKSTLMKLMLSLYRPQSGCLSLIRGEQKQELRSAHRDLFAYVPQGNMLMSGTVRNVVAFDDLTDKDADDAIWQALRVACADEFVSQLPGELDAVLGEHGEGLSEGQMQRLAVARAVYSGRPVLLLDEATSALDEETEAQLLLNLRQLRDRTVLMVTHRPKALELCDCVISLYT